MQQRWQSALENWRVKSFADRLQLAIVYAGMLSAIDIHCFLFAHPSRTQLCINFANEKLQQYFLTFVLKKEQEIYESEGVEVRRFGVSLLLAACKQAACFS